MDKGVFEELIFDTYVPGIIKIFLAKYQWDNIWARWMQNTAVSNMVLESAN